MKHCIAVWVFLLLGGNAHAQQQWSIELGYLRAFHKDLGVTQQDWILVDGTWTDPANLPGQVPTHSPFAILVGFMDLTTIYRYSLVAYPYQYRKTSNGNWI